MSIKTWLSRLEVKPVNTSEEIEAAMQAEIDELRAALAERDAEIQRQYVCIASHSKITQAAESKVEAQRKVLESIKQEAETGLVIGDEIGMRDALTQILLEVDGHLGISVMKEPS